MNRVLIGVAVAVLAILATSLYGNYSQAQKTGELESRLELSNKINKDWADAYTTLQLDMEARQRRADEAIARSHVRQQAAAQKEQLFRVEIDQLKEKNDELRQLLETRIPDSILGRLCAEGYASAAVCQGLLPPSR